MTVQRVIVLGSTGSIGRASLEVLAALGDRFTVCGLAAGSNWQLLARQAAKFRPQVVALAEERDADRLREAVPAGCEVIAGPESATGLIERSEAEIVIAAGAWTPMLAKQLGCTIPIQPGKGYSITTGKLDAAPSVPCFFDEKSVVATPWPDGFRLGGTMEFSGYDDTLNQKRLTALSTAAVQYIKGSGIGDIEKEWCGLRPMTYDGLPIIDRSPLLENVTIAAGHNMLGLSMGPGTGQLVAEMLNGEPPHIDPKPYALKRFSQNVNTT